jgi:hypothetical protein
MATVRKISRCPDCGAILRGRSLPDMRRFFGVLRKAYQNWPELHEFQPSSEEELRAWCLVRAKYLEVEHVAYPEFAHDDPHIKKIFRLAVEGSFAAIHRRRGYAELRVTAAGIDIITPRSIAFASLSQKEFNPVRDEVEAVIEDALGVTAEQLLQARAA